MTRKRPAELPIKSVNISNFSDTRKECLRNLLIYKRVSGRGKSFLVGVEKYGDFYAWTGQCPNQFEKYYRRHNIFWKTNHTPHNYKKIENIKTQDLERVLNLVCPSKGFDRWSGAKEAVFPLKKEWMVFNQDNVDGENNYKMHVSGSTLTLTKYDSTEEYDAESKKIKDPVLVYKNVLGGFNGYDPTYKYNQGNGASYMFHLTQNQYLLVTGSGLYHKTINEPVRYFFSITINGGNNSDYIIVTSKQVWGFDDHKINLADLNTERIMPKHTFWKKSGPYTPIPSDPQCWGKWDFHEMVARYT